MPGPELVKNTWEDKALRSIDSRRRAIAKWSAPEDRDRLQKIIHDRDIWEYLEYLTWLESFVRMSIWVRDGKPEVPELEESDSEPEPDSDLDTRLGE